MIAFSAFTIAFCGSLLFAPLIRFVSTRYGFVDKPDAERKIQEAPVALGGGLILWLGIMAGSVSAVWGFYPESVARVRPGAMLGYFFASAIIVAVGLFDDIRGMRGRHKLFFQCVVAAIAVGSGGIIESVDLFGTQIPLGIFGVLVSIVWVLGSINAFNLIDGVDGLAGSVGLVISLAVGCLALMRQENHFDAIVAFSLAASLMVFLSYNRAPATIYLGDTGSMLIGLVLGTLALRSGGKESATVAAAPLVAMWAVLILDSIAAIARRKLSGRSIYDCDRGHIHHRLLERGCSATQTSLIIAGLCGLTSLAAVASQYFGHPIIGVLFALVVIASLAISRVFGHMELELAKARIVQARESSLGKISKSAVQIQGDSRWEKLWQAASEAAERFGLLELQLNLHAPRQHQDFYASWTDSVRHPEPANCWRIERPLVIHGVVVGRIVARGQQTNGVGKQIAFLEFADSLMPQVESLVDDKQVHALHPVMTENSLNPVGLAKSRKFETSLLRDGQL